MIANPAIAGMVKIARYRPRRFVLSERKATAMAMRQAQT
jgi:hypothetical protein